MPKDKAISIAENPPVASLGYAAAALYLWLQLEYEKKPTTYAQRISDRTDEVFDPDDDIFPFYEEEEGGFFFE